MKYLKYFEGVNNISIEDIKDILIELEHDGFYYKLEKHDKSINYLLDIGQGLNGWYSLEIRKNKSDNKNWKHDEFRIDEVSDVIWRLVDYLDKGFLSIHVLNWIDDKYAWRIFTIDTIMDSNIKCKGVKISFEI